MSTAKVSGLVYQVRYRYYRSCKELWFRRKSNTESLRCYATEKMPNISNSRKSTLFLGIVGVSVGAVIGAGYSYFKAQQPQKHVMNPDTGITNNIVQDIPDIPISRRVIGSMDNTGLKLKLFQYPTCPFCCKVRAFLDYFGFSYDIIEVNPVMRQQIKWSQYKKVPILLVQVDNGYLQLNDSSMIISALTSYLHERDQGLPEVVKCYPTISYTDDDGSIKKEIMNRYFLMFQEDIPKDRTKENILLERKWRKWADDVLVHMLSPNVYRTLDEAFQAFNWFSEVGEWDKHFPAWERFMIVYVGAVAMWLISKRLKKRHSLKDDVRQSLYDECNVWLRTLKKQGTKYLGGSSPNLADLAVYGVLSSIEGCRAFQDLQAHTKMGGWYQDMQQFVQKHGGAMLMSS
ncbi:prostaglandin E synthase 2 [Anabrus simplex]|uniref:prostaglandin E synthase 2 n=1 Tax=Anabrus simplex TaxID=316456 RepID=UPI0034DCD89E